MRWLVVLLLAGCGRWEFDPRNDASTIDAFYDPDARGPLGTFGAPTAVVGIDGGPNDDPTLTSDLLEIYFDSDRAGGLGLGDVWVATRSSATAPFAAPTLVTELATAADDTSPKLAGDLTLYFASDRAAVNDRDIYISTRASRGAPWSVPTRIAEISTTTVESAAMPTGDGLLLVFTTDRNGNDDLYEARRQGVVDVWSQVSPIGALTTNHSESQAWINDDATVVYYTLYAPTTAMADIWMATRASRDLPFNAPVPITELNSAANDSDPWLSPDQRTIFFSSNRSGVDQIFMATR